MWRGFEETNVKSAFSYLRNTPIGAIGATAQGAYPTALRHLDAIAKV